MFNLLQLYKLIIVFIISGLISLFFCVLFKFNIFLFLSLNIFFLFIFLLLNNLFTKYRYNRMSPTEKNFYIENKNIIDYTPPKEENNKE